MKKFYALLLSVVLLSACAASDSLMEDQDDGMMENEKMMDDGTVDGKTHEDAGGDGTNTTGGSAVDPKNASGDSRVLYVEISDWQFSPSTITVKKGEEVSLELESVSGDHGVSIPGLGINVAVSQGDIMYVDIPTDTVGTFEGVCNVPCGSGHRDMHITVIVTE